MGFQKGLFSSISKKSFSFDMYINCLSRSVHMNQCEHEKALLEAHKPFQILIFQYISIFVVFFKSLVSQGLMGFQKGLYTYFHQ